LRGAAQGTTSLRKDFAGFPLKQRLDAHASIQIVAAAFQRRIENMISDGIAAEKGMWYHPPNQRESTMTAVLEKAFAKASRLPRPLQEQLARQLLEDLEGESSWDQTLKNSQPLLEKMAGKAREAHRQRKTTRKGFDEL
jgi:hypothetical protein